MGFTDCSADSSRPSFLRRRVEREKRNLLDANPVQENTVLVFWHWVQYGFSHFVCVRVVLVHLYQRGMGTMLVLLHGFAGDVHAWDEVVAHLPASIGAAGLTCPGHAGDPVVDGGFGDTVDAVAQTLRTISQEPVHLVGYSLGARIALGVALNHPEQVRQTTLIGGHIGLPTEAERSARREADQHWISLLETQGIEAFVDAWEKQPIFASQAHLSATARQTQRQRRLRHQPAGLAASLRSVGLGAMPNFWPCLGRARVPIHFVAGGDDAKFRSIARQAHQAAPMSTLDVIAGCGHNPLVEAPAALAAVLAGYEIDG